MEEILCSATQREKADANNTLKSSKRYLKRHILELWAIVKRPKNSSHFFKIHLGQTSIGTQENYCDQIKTWVYQLYGAPDNLGSMDALIYVALPNDISKRNT